MSPLGDIIGLGPAEAARERFILSPFQFLVSGEDNLRVTSFNSLASVVLTMTGRFFDLATRDIQAFTFTHTPNTDGTAAQSLHQLGTGYLLNLAVRATTGSPSPGRTYVLIELVRGLTGATQFLATLGADYVTARQGLSWPGSAVVSSTAGEGAIRSITVANPAAGADWVHTVPTGFRWEVVSIAALFTTDANAANRRPQIVFTDGTTAVFRGAASANFTASTGWLTSWAQGHGSVADATSGVVTGGLPVNNRVLAGFVIASSTGAIQAADAWTNIRLSVREWLEAA